MKKERRQVAQAPVAELKDEDIELILTCPVKPVTPLQAENALKEALSLFDRRTESPGGRYKCVKAFKEYRASKEFEDPRHALKYKQALDDLAEQVKAVYKTAVAREAARDWPAASREWQKLFLMLPEDDPASPVSGRLLKNIQDHWAQVKARLSRR
jgi:hypothetical protein